MYSVCRAGKAVGRAGQVPTVILPFSVRPAIMSDGRAFPRKQGSARCGRDERLCFQQPVGGGVSGAGNGASFRSNAKWMIRHTTPTLIAESATLNAGQ